MESADRFAPGTVLAGKLRIVRQLGAGGMGAVFEVEHELTRHRRALKLLHAQMASIPSVVERFLREASAAGRIGNPHIVETFDAGRLESGEPYIVMEMLSGKTLSEVLDERGPLSLDTACEVVIQACDAVSAAHAAGIVHRDLKPENLFLCGADLSFVKILDFGVSKFDSATTGVQGLTLEGSPIGTPYYMSPEQVRGEATIDARSDVYALGVLFYECLTGRKPFMAETLPHLAVLIYQGKYDTPSQVRQGLPPAADLVVSRAMASDRDERFSTAKEFALAVARLRNSVAPIAMNQTQPADPPASALKRPAPALTPGVFTSPAPASHPSTPASKGWVLAAAISVAVAGVAGSFLLRKAPPAPPGPEASTHSSAPPVLVVPQPPPPVTVAPLVEPVAPQPSALPAASGVASTQAASHASTAPKPATSGNAPRSRASSYGLSQENPFK